VPLVSKPLSLACRGERLARAGTGPRGAVVGPSGASEGVGPDADPGEEVALNIPGKVAWSDILDAPIVHVTGGDDPCPDQLPQRRSASRIDLVVIGGHPGFSTRTYLVP